MTNQDFDLTGKIAIVTGGRNGNVGPIIMQVLKDYRANSISFDLPDFDITNKISRDYFHKLVYIAPDIIVCNAAIDNPPHTQKKFFDDFNKIMEVNLQGHIELIKLFLPDMQKKGGVIIMIGSIMGYIGADYRNYPDDFEKPLAYNLSKWAYRGLAKSLGVQYGRYGIRAVCPGFGPVDTGKFQEPFKNKILATLPLGKLITPKSIRQTIIYVCCCEELTGQDFCVDSGYTAW